jgi:hypothetical protein
VLALLLPFEPLRMLLAAPLALFLPGYAIAAAIFARGRIRRSQFLVFSLGLSLVVLALGALLLNYMPGGIRAWSWALLLFAVVLGCCRGAALRRPRRAPAPVAWSLPRANGPQLALFLGGGLALLAAVVLAFTPLTATKAIGFTEIWIQPLAAGNGVRIGVGSGERDDSSYRLQVRFGAGKTVTRRFELEPGQREVMALGGAGLVSATGGPIPVSAILYKEDSPEPDHPFRQVSTWLPAPAGPG